MSFWEYLKIVSTYVLKLIGLNHELVFSLHLPLTFLQPKLQLLQQSIITQGSFQSLILIHLVLLGRTSLKNKIKKKPRYLPLIDVRKRNLTSLIGSIIFNFSAN